MLRILLVTLPLRLDDDPAMVEDVACHERNFFNALLVDCQAQSCEFRTPVSKAKRFSRAAQRAEIMKPRVRTAAAVRRPGCGSPKVEPQRGEIHPSEHVALISPRWGSERKTNRTPGGGRLAPTFPGALLS